MSEWPFSKVTGLGSKNIDGGLAPSGPDADRESQRMMSGAGPWPQTISSSCRAGPEKVPVSGPGGQVHARKAPDFCRVGRWGV